MHVLLDACPQQDYEGKFVSLIDFSFLEVSFMPANLTSVSADHFFQHFQVGFCNVYSQIVPQNI